MDGDRAYYNRAFYNRAFYNREYLERDERFRYRNRDTNRFAYLLVNTLVDLIVYPIVWAFWFCDKLGTILSVFRSIYSGCLSIVCDCVVLCLKFFFYTPLFWASVWILLCAAVHYADWYQGAHGLLARKLFDLANPAGSFWAVHAGELAPASRVLRLLGDMLYPFGVSWTVLFPTVLDASTGTWRPALDVLGRNAAGDAA